MTRRAEIHRIDTKTKTNARDRDFERVPALAEP
jgi:hypothetical protein